VAESPASPLRLAQRRKKFSLIARPRNNAACGPVALEPGRILARRDPACHGNTGSRLGILETIQTDAAVLELEQVPTAYGQDWLPARRVVEHERQLVLGGQAAAPAGQLRRIGAFISMNQNLPFASSRNSMVPAGMQLNRFCASGLEASIWLGRKCAPAGKTWWSPAASNRCRA
jgi:hypothetical protein